MDVALRVRQVGPGDLDDDFDVADQAFVEWVRSYLEVDELVSGGSVVAPASLESDHLIASIVVAANEPESGPFGDDPEQIVSLLEYFAVTCHHDRSRPSDSSFGILDISGHTVAIGIVLPEPLVVEDPAEWTERLRELVFEGTPVRTTDRSGPGTKGTRAIEGFPGSFAVAVGVVVR